MPDYYDPENPPTGPELLDEPDFDAVGAWEMDPEWTIPLDGTAICVAPSDAPTLYQYVADLVADREYFCHVKVNSIVGNLRFSLASGPYYDIASVGVFSFSLVCSLPALPFSVRNSGSPGNAIIDYIRLSDSEAIDQNIVDAFESDGFVTQGTRIYDKITDTPEKQCFRLSSLEDKSRILFLIEPE